MSLGILLQGALQQDSHSFKEHRSSNITPKADRLIQYALALGSSNARGPRREGQPKLSVLITPALRSSSSTKQRADPGRLGSKQYLLHRRPHARRKATGLLPRATPCVTKQGLSTQIGCTGAKPRPRRDKIVSGGAFLSKSWTPGCEVHQPRGSASRDPPPHHPPPPPVTPPAASRPST